MRRRPARYLVLLALAAGAAAQGVSFAKAAADCSPIDDVVAGATEQPACCDKAGQDRWNPAGGDCCTSAFLEEDVPVASSAAAPDVPPTKATWVPHRHTLHAALASAGEAHAWHRSYRLPPPTASPVDDYVVLRN